MGTFRKTKIAAAIAAATLATSANAVVVVGGDNGWEVSFDGNVNAFYTFINRDVTRSGVNQNTDSESSRVHAGFLPAFFSFNVKSPTVNGLTGTGRFSFAPTIGGAKQKNDLYGTATSGLSSGLQGASIDTREVLANVEGSFGTISFGRTLSIFGRQAILHDMTLFGVGNTNGATDFGSVTAGRIGHGYAYPDFEARFSYKTPNMNGFQMEVGAYDPSEPGGLVSGGASGAFETPVPRFEGELTFATTFTGGSFLAWVDGQWQDIDGTAPGGDDLTVSGVGVGAQLNWNAAAITGYYQTGNGISNGFQFGALGPGGLLPIVASGLNCVTAAICDEADNDSWYVQGTWTFGGKTKVGVSYGESNQDGQFGTATQVAFNEVSNSMWSVGVYHDMTSWLKLIAEYNNLSDDATCTPGSAGSNFGGPCPASGRISSFDTESFSVGAFLTW